MSIPIQQETSTVHTTAKAGRSIVYLVLHYTAGTRSTAGTAAAVAKMFATSSTQASADFIVDDETIVQYNPDLKNRYTWHCGGSKYATGGGRLYGTAKNANSIGIEICSTNSTGKVPSPNDKSWGYTAAALAQARVLVKHLMETYGIDQDHVIRHYDVTGKLCPGIVGWNADSGDESQWNAFLASLSQTEQEEPEMTKLEVEALIDGKLAALTDLTGTGDHPSSWAKEAAEWAKKSGLIQGDGAGNYGWQKLLTREQAAELMRTVLSF